MNRNTRPYQLPEKIISPAADLENFGMETIKQLIHRHSSMMRRYEYLEAMYKGFHSVLMQPEKEEWKPDNRLVVNFPRYITETFLGYAYGIPIKESHPDDAVQEILKTFQDNNEITDHEYELFQDVCIYGHAFEYLYQDEDAQTRMTVCTPEELFIVYDDTVRSRALMAIRYARHQSRNGQDGDLFGEVMTPDEIYTFDGDKPMEVRENPYGKIPVVEYFMNRQRISLFENVTTLIETYNHAIGEKANDVDAFAEAYLAILGADVDDDGVRRIRDDRVINLCGTDNAKDVIVQFLSKPTADVTQENLLNRLENLIYQTSMVCNISDESFGNASSGTALSYKMLAMSNLAAGFDRKIEKSLRKRYKLFCAVEANGVDEDAWKELQVTTSRNLPKNRLEEAQTAAQLSGIVSKETQLSLLSIVPDPKSEIDKMRAEEDDSMTLLDFNNHTHEGGNPDEREE